VIPIADMRPRSPRPLRAGSGGVARVRAKGAVLALAVAMLTGCAAAAPAAEPDSVSSSTPTASPTPTPEPSRPASSTARAVVGVEPERVAIPAIDLDEPLIPLGIAAEGDIEVPENYDDVGWFTGGGRPGGHGPTVIAAHVDNGWGPAVFARLTELRPGDEVVVTDIEGTRATYVVTETADHPRADFPTARVFGAVGEDVLRLITCTGFDPAASEYLDNRVVYAERVD
jgi:LPXTG-site transpeptidase (sortase) family protein